LNILLTWVCFLASLTTCFAYSVVLQWDVNTDPGVAGYKVYYQQDSPARPFIGTGASQGDSPVDAHNQTTATLSGLDPAHSYYFAVTAYNASGLESAYSNIVFIPELISPTVSISAPANNATVSGTVSVTAAASDNVGVTTVEFYLNGVLQNTNTEAPYLYPWNTSALAAGTYTLMAKAYDAAGNVGQSANVSVTVVKDTTAPTVTITSPANNATVSGTVPISVSATDNVGVSTVEFYENGTLLSATNVTPYSFTWNTTSVANGTHTLIAKGYDASGNVGQSANVLVTVNNTGPDTTAPSASVVSPANNASVSGMVTVTASVSDNVGVSRVRFYVNGSLKSTVTTAPYVYNWDTSSLAAGTYTLYVRANDAANNVKQSSTITVSVFKDSTAPSVSVMVPANGATVSNVVAVTANVADNATVTKVEFYVNNVLQGTATAAPYSINWNTTALSNGSSYTVYAKAYDTSNNVGQSANVVVTVSNIIFNQGTGVYYSSLQQAYDNASTGATLLLLSLQDNENITCTQQKSVVIRGGFDQGFTLNSGYTSLYGTYTIGQGTVVVDRLIIS